MLNVRMCSVVVGCMCVFLQQKAVYEVLISGLSSVVCSSDLKGLKFPAVGLAIDMYSTMGAAVNALPGGEIVPALDRGLLDGAEFNNASSDLALGFPDVSKICMLQSFHQSAEQFEILFNKTKYETLPKHLKHVQIGRAHV